jgi:hypothetical protein
MSISLAPAGIRVAGQNLISGFPPSCALWLREMYFFATAPAPPGSGAATEDSPPRIRADSRPFAGQNLLSGFSPSCASWLREMYFFATVPARLDLGLPRRTALQGFAQIRVHMRAKICFPVFPLRVLCGSVRCIFSQRCLRAWIWGCHGGQPSKDSRGFASIRGLKSAFRYSPSVCFVAP